MRLDLPASMKIHNVFHMDLLLPYKETEQYGTPYTCPPPIINSEEEYKIENILEALLRLQRALIVRLVLRGELVASI